ncbi:MAG: hypothetical protein KF718_27705 [Polyangiaceae bacterium]|nr:hypothetical protein [Polyangiaceae bacterium]
MHSRAGVWLLVALAATSCRSSPERHDAGSAGAAASASAAVAAREASPLERALRPVLTGEAEAVVSAFSRLQAEATRRDRDAAWAAYLELRRAWRRLLPLSALFTYGSQLEPPQDEPEEVPAELGLAALRDALLASPPDFDALDAALTRTRPAVAVAPSEARVMALREPEIALALSRGVFRWGQILDGSLCESLEEERIDAVDGGRALVAAARRVRDAAVGREAAPDGLLDAVTAFDAWLDAQPPKSRLTNKLRGLMLSGRLGAELRKLLAARGAAVPAPYLAARPSAEVAHEEPISVAVFPRLRGAPPRADRAALGRALFFDERLSRDATMSCASCHRASHALSSGPVRPRAADGSALARDVPGLWNVAFEPMFFWDGRASTLERQIELAVERDLQGRWPEILARLSKDAELTARMRAAFGVEVDAASVKTALGEFERTLVLADTPFERFVRGDEAALGAEELRGFDVLFGHARCTRCHRLPLTSGALPPRFTRSEVSALGVPAGPGVARLDPDRGRGAITGLDRDAHAFKTPTLRNLALTAPYFHNGAFRTLEQVVDFYRDGSGPGLGVGPASFDPDARAFELSAAERRALLAFLRRGLLDPGATASPP